jgi:NAD(P)-dependent dehydrogenase (short-subunit alcohol dehydrogenase family)
VIVTGGNRGIGLAIARSLSAEGVGVTIAARDAEALAAARKLLAKQAGAVVTVVSVDTGDDESVRTMVDIVVAELGGVDILVSCAARPNAGITNLANLTNEQFMDAIT